MDCGSGFTTARQGPTSHNAGRTDVNKHNFEVSPKTAAEASACVSNPDCHGFAGYEENHHGIDDSLFSNKQDGFLANLYTNPKTGVSILAFAPTETPMDWAQDVIQALGIFNWAPSQYFDAVTLAQRVQATVGDRLMLTGFSLGGGLAAAGALAAHVHAITFDAPGLSDTALGHFHLDRHLAPSLIMNYHTMLDPLTWSQNHSPLPDALGRQIALPGYHGHSMSGVCASVQSNCQIWCMRHGQAAFR